MTPNLPDLIEVPLGRAGKYGSVTVSCDRFTDEVQKYLYAYGLRQVLNDAMATKTDDDGNALSADDIVAKATKRLQNLYDGTLRSRSVGEAEPLDPFDAECHRIVIGDLMQIFRAGGNFKGLPKGTKDQLMFVVNTERAKVGKPEIDRAELVALRMQDAAVKKSVERRAKEALAAREAAAFVA